MTSAGPDIGLLLESELKVTDVNDRQGGAVRAFLHHRTAVVAFVILVLLVLAPLLAPLLGASDTTTQDLSARLQDPSWKHLMGTDELGRDEFARVLAATRISLSAALLATAVGIVLGVPLGLATGYLGGRVDSIIGRIFDAVQSVPPLILAIAIVAIFGRSLTPAMIAIGIVFSPQFYRISRAAASTVAAETYIEASRSMGQRTYQILATHVLGNVSSSLTVQTSNALAFGILAEAALSYLGLGVQPPSASLGSMLTAAANHLNDSFLLIVEPGAVIVLLVLCISLVGDAIHDIAAGTRSF